MFFHLLGCASPNWIQALIPTRFLQILLLELKLFRGKKIPILYIQPLHWISSLPSILQTWLSPVVIPPLQCSQEILFFLFCRASGKCSPWSLVSVPEDGFFLFPKPPRFLVHIFSIFLEPTNVLYWNIDYFKWGIFFLNWSIVNLYIFLVSSVQQSDSERFCTWINS